MSKVARITIEDVFEVEYRYYQFNSGAADNGYYTRKVTCGSAEEAASLAARMNAAAAKEMDDDERYALEEEYIPYSGNFEWANAYRLRIERMPLAAVKVAAPAPAV